jgi:tetratricopeptide (TPR) repeat protein
LYHSPGFTVKNVLIIVTLSALFSACTTFPQPNASNPASKPLAATGSLGTVTRLAEVSAPDDDLTQILPDPNANVPSASLSPEILQKLLISELAQQRGDWQASYVTLLSVAQQTRDPRLAKRAMEVALDAKQANEALAAIRLWRQLAPKADEPNQYYLRFIVFSDDLTEAQTLLTTQLRNAAPHERGYTILQIQQILRYAKDKNAAFSVLEQLVAPYPEWIESRLALSEAAYLKGDIQRSLREARAARAIRPSSEEAVLTHALVISDPQEVAQELADHLAVYPKAHQVRLALARKLIDLRQYSKARREFEKVLEADPKNSATLFVLGVVTLYDNDAFAAETYFKTYLAALEAEPDSERDPSQAYSYLAQIAEDRDDSEAALKWLTRMAESERRPENQFGIQLRRASLMAKGGSITQARVLLKSLQPTKEEDKVRVILAESQLLRQANQNQPAFAVLDAALKLYPKNPELLYDHALAAEKVGRWSVMEASLRRLISLMPNHHNAYNALGYSLAERNIRLPEALSLIETALKLSVNDPFILDSLGWVQFKMGNLNEAEQSLRRAYDLRPDAEIGVHLGEVLWHQGRKDEAQKIWREARNKAPKNSALKSTLVRLNVRLQ